MNAIPHVLNYGSRLAQDADPRRTVIGPTVYLTSLVHDGYNLTIFQSDYADYCSGSKFSECITYDGSSLRPTLQLPLPSVERTGLIGFSSLASLSDAVRAISIPWNVTATTHAVAVGS